MRKLSEVRRDNLRRIVDLKGGGTKVAALLGYRSPSFLSQQIGPKPTREITEKSAREYETKLDLPAGTLDREEPVEAPSAPANVALVSDVIRMLGTVLADENVTLPPQRFADVAVLAFEDAAERGKPREGHIRSLVRLLK